VSNPEFADVRHAQGRFTGSAGARLFYQAWRPRNSPPRAALVNLHGLGDHSGLYPNLGNRMPGAGLALYAYDMRGNGRSPGQRAYLRGWYQYREDLHAFLAQVREWEPGLPVFLLGNSLGGLVVLEYALHHVEGLTGVIAAAPPLGKLGVPPILMGLGRLLSRVLPRFSLRVGMDLTGLARDPAVVQAVLADPFFHRWGTARLSTEVIAAIERVQSGAASYRVPLLVLHGSADRMVLPDGSRIFFSKVKFPGSELKEYPEAYHGLFADLNADEVMGDLLAWIEARLGQTFPSQTLAAERALE
jgi:alpha-beta hydrolase superfamily lysophospholipase